MSNEIAFFKHQENTPRSSHATLLEENLGGLAHYISDTRPSLGRLEDRASEQGNSEKEALMKRGSLQLGFIERILQADKQQLSDLSEENQADSCRATAPAV